MNIRIRMAGAAEIELSPVRPAEHPSQPGNTSFGASGPFGDIRLLHIEGEGISMLHHNMQFHEDEEVLYMMDEKVIRLQIVLHNSYFFHSKHFGEGAVHERGLHFHTVPETHTTFRMRAGQSYRHLSLFYRPEHLEDLQPSFPRLGEFLDKARQGDPMIYNEAYSVAGSRVISLVDFLIENRYDGALQSAWFGTLAKDLLMESLLRIEDSRSNRPIPLGEEAVERVYQTKELLLRNMHMPFSLSHLSAETGINAFRLTREFKAVYGIGLKEFLLESRMRKAIRALSGSDQSVGAVASTSGYATAQSFSLAFKNYFGCTPGSVHRRGRSTGENDQMSF